MRVLQWIQQQRFMSVQNSSNDNPVQRTIYETLSTLSARTQLSVARATAAGIDEHFFFITITATASNLFPNMHARKQLADI